MFGSRRLVLLLALVCCTPFLIAQVTVHAPRVAYASGTCGGTIGATFEINPGWDYLAIKVMATGVTGCTSPLYQFAFWNGSAREVFQDYTSNSTAYWDTGNLTGQQYISIYVKDSTSPNQYDTYSPWIGYTLSSHNNDDSFDPRQNGTYLQNFDPQGAALDSNGNYTPWLSTYIEYLPGSNGIANANSIACPGGRVYPWQGAYASGLPGNSPSGAAFVQPGFNYQCNGQAGQVFAVAGTTAAINCPYGGATNFGATDDTILSNGSGVSSSTSVELKGCYVPVSTFGISSGQQANFDMHSVGNTLYMGVNGNAIFSATQSSSNSPGFIGPWLDTEIANTYDGIGYNMNQGMQVYTLITQSWYYDDTNNQWVQLPNNTANVNYGLSYTSVFKVNVGSNGDAGLYCDRPFGYYYGWNSGYPSSYVFGQNLFGHCGN